VQLVSEGSVSDNRVMFCAVINPSAAVYNGGVAFLRHLTVCTGHETQEQYKRTVIVYLKYAVNISIKLSNING